MSVIEVASWDEAATRVRSTEGSFGGDFETNAGAMGHEFARLRALRPLDFGIVHAGEDYLDFAGIAGGWFHDVEVSDTGLTTASMLLSTIFSLQVDLDGPVNGE